MLSQAVKSANNPRVQTLFKHSTVLSHNPDDQSHSKTPKSLLSSKNCERKLIMENTAVGKKVYSPFASRDTVQSKQGHDRTQNLSELLHTYQPSRTLRSSSEKLFKVPQTSLKSAGNRSVHHQAAKIWNSLPTNVRSSPSLSSFKKNLKTHLFKERFSLGL